MGEESMGPFLTNNHLSHLTGSAISIEVINERGYKSILGKKELSDIGFSKNQQRPPGLLIPLHGPDGSAAGYQYRPDNPRSNKKGKPIKYETPPNSTLCLDMPIRCKEDIKNPGAPLWITEGAKKIDALASVGACAVSLNGVWGFKGRNEWGSSTVLVDFDYVALADRLVYLAFDADIKTNKKVRQALDRLTNHLKRKKAIVKIINLPAGPDDQKAGVDDYLAEGHTLTDLQNLAIDELEEFEEEAIALHNPVYCVHEGQYCLIKNIEGMKVKSPLCNFTAQVKEEVIHDDGISETRHFIIGGQLSNGNYLPDIEVPVSSYTNLDWVLKQWGGKALVCPGSSTKDHLRYMIQRSMNGAAPRWEYEHTGWRDIDGSRVFLSATGGLGHDGINVSLPRPLAGYALPVDPEAVGPDESMGKSLQFMEIGNPRVMVPLWAEMYLAPLAEVIQPAFTMWLQGGSGSFKSTLSALALCHFGEFTYLSLPASWRDTDNFLLSLLSRLKDLPLVIDDWHPASTVAEQRALEKKVGVVIRGQGNRAGRGRLKADATFQDAPPPRALAISSGEQAPDGESNAARLFVLEVARSDIEPGALTMAQDNSYHYRYAMAHYIQWLANDWKETAAWLAGSWAHYRALAVDEGIHLRLPMAVASLYSALDLAMEYAVDVKAISKDAADERRDQAWEILCLLAKRQGITVDRERAGARFLSAFKVLLEQKRIWIIQKDQYEVESRRQGQEFVGWEDEEFWYLIPGAIYREVYEVCNRGGQTFTFKEEAVWRDLKIAGVTESQEGRNQSVVRVGMGTASCVRRVIQLRKSAVTINSEKERVCNV